jgi:two-component system response regulator YesN
MINLLIVDDEPIGLEGLSVFLEDELGAELHISSACSAMDALAIANEIRIDILLSDISMPEINGLQLAERIKQIWSRCRIIFLTGYKDFEYVQTALRTGGMDYVLKTEGDERILHAVLNAISDLEREWSGEQLLQHARGNLNKAMPIIRRDYIMGLLRGEHSLSMRRNKFTELEMELEPESDLLLAIGRIDHWPTHLNTEDRSLLMYSIQNIAEELLAVHCSIQFIAYGQSRFMMLIQPKGIMVDMAMPHSWKQTCGFVQGTLETIQLTCSNLLKLSISIVVDVEPRVWDSITAAFEQLQQQLNHGVGDGKQMLLLSSPVAVADNAMLPTATQEERTDQLVLNIQRYIREYIQGPLSLTIIANKFYMNSSYLSRIYKQRTGKGLLEFINETRIQLAMELILSTDYKVQEIAMSAGFDSAHYFTRLFKKMTGMTPMEYRIRQMEI